MNDKSFEGGCACGYVRYRMNSKPMYVHCCHCTECQRLSGAAFAINAMIEADRVELLAGEVAEVIVPSTSGEGQKIYRCPKCQVAVWSHYALDEGIGNLVNFIRVGTLDDPNQLPPDVHIFTSTKQAWVNLSDEAHVVDVYYDRFKMWPKDSQARRAALEKT